MSAMHWGLILTVLTGFAAGAAAMAWDARQVVIALAATVAFQIAAIACFLIGTQHRRKRTVIRGSAKNPLTPPVRADTIPSHTPATTEQGIEN